MKIPNSEKIPTALFNHDNCLNGARPVAFLKKI